MTEPILQRLTRGDLPEENTVMRCTRHLLLACILSTFSLPVAAQEVEVDISACRGVYKALKTMHDGAPKEQVSGMLDTLLDTRPYQVMFKHYNRSWRPNELPKPVFKRMILSLRFPEEYSAGENERADTMRPLWAKYYPDLSVYESQLHQLEAADLHKLINEGVRFAQSWLPLEWKIPNFYLAVIPNGGSSAFAIEGTQGYDFFQLAPTPGKIDVNELVGTVAHESHHLGIRLNPPSSLSSADAMAYRVVTLSISEGAATYFISGSPAGRAPAFPEAHFHEVFTPDLTKAWDSYVAEEEELVQRQAALLDRAVTGNLTEDAFNTELREYWLNGVIGRAYVLGSETFGAIYAAFGKTGAISAMQNPRQIFQMYNEALNAKPDLLKRCVRIPNKTVRQALAIGQDH
jgi:hypothetical protein